VTDGETFSKISILALSSVPKSPVACVTGRIATRGRMNLKGLMPRKSATNHAHINIIRSLIHFMSFGFREE